MSDLPVNDDSNDESAPDEEAPVTTTIDDIVPITRSKRTAAVVGERNRRETKC